MELCKNCHSKTTIRSFLIYIVLFLIVTPTICWASRPFAGYYDSYYDTEPKMVVLRYEIVDSESRAPVKNAEVILKGDYERKNIKNELYLRATTGPDGLVVFGLSWKPWEYSYDHDVARVKSIEVRHSQHRFLKTNNTGLESLADEEHPYYIFNYKHIGKFEEWLSGTGSKIFFFDNTLSRSEFFNRIHNRDYGRLEIILYHSIDTAKNRSGPFIVIEKEIAVKRIALTIKNAHRKLENSGGIPTNAKEKIVDHWPNGAPRYATYWIRKGQEFSKVGSRMWYRNGKLFQEVPFQNGKENGIRKEWHKNGQLKLKAPFQNGKENGIRKEWHKNGKIESEISYQNGKRNGIEKVWYSNGQLKLEWYFQNGKIEGIRKEWHKNGQLKLKVSYQNGKANGIEKAWYSNGLPKFEGHFQNGKANGIVKEWYEDGKIKFKTSYKNGKRHGFRKGWHENERRWFETPYQYGEEHGIEKNWYSHGQIRYERFYQNGKTIREKRWDKNGRLIK